MRGGLVRLRVLGSCSLAIHVERPMQRQPRWTFLVAAFGQFAHVVICAHTIGLCWRWLVHSTSAMTSEWLPLANRRYTAAMPAAWDLVCHAERDHSMP